MDHRAGSEAGVVVVAGGDGPRLERCLSALAETAADVEAQVVAVLNGAAPDACAVAREHPRADVVVECSSTVGFAAAANLGRRHTAAPRLVFPDADTVVHPGTIRRLLAVLGERPQTGACGPLILGGDGRVRAPGPVLFADGRSGAPASGEARRTDFCRLCALAVRTEAFDDAGGFEEAYFPRGFTAADLGLALRRAGRGGWVGAAAAGGGGTGLRGGPAVGAPAGR